MKKNENGAAEDRVFRSSEQETANSPAAEAPWNEGKADIPAVLKNAEPTKKRSGWRICLLVLTLLLLAILIPVIVLTTAFIMKYRSTSYEYQKPVEREVKYVMPDYPEVIVIPDGVDPVVFVSRMESLFSTEDPVPAMSATSAQSAQTQLTEPGKPTQTQPTQTQQTVPETEGAQPPSPAQESGQTAQPESDRPSQPQWTGEALSNDINVPTQTGAADGDAQASFANSPNAVSVYAGVPIYKVKQKDPNVQNILVLGTDSRDVTMDRGRSDVMMIVSYNKKTGSVKLTSLLRDSFVPIEGYGWERLNTAYFYGGVGLTINTINQLYGLDIQSFVVVDFNGVKDFIDYIGGVDVYLTQAEADYYAWDGITEGINHLNRDQALAHMRNRHLDSDFGRTRRQRDVITAVLKAVTQKSLTEIYDITDYAFSLMRTNISATSMASLAASVLSNASKLSITTQNVPTIDAFQNVYCGSLGVVLSYDIGAAAVQIHSFIYE